MALREFTDGAGVPWVVWEVQPRSIERRVRDDPTVVAVVGDRRVRTATETRVRINSTLAHGWLAFETRGERRRLAPYPTGWFDLNESALRELLDAATPIARSGRLIE